MLKSSMLICVISLTHCIISPIGLEFAQGETDPSTENRQTQFDEPSENSEADAPRPYHEINQDINAFFKRETTAIREKELDLRMAAIRDLCSLYYELKTDPRVESSPTLRGYKAKVWKRLTRIKSDVSKQIKRIRGKSPKEEQGNLPPMVDKQTIAMSLSTDHLAQQMRMTGFANGGPGHAISYFGGSFGGGTIEDYADDLVELIQTTIAPEFWDVNGGPGSIYFYRPLNALVIRATSRIHESLGGTLDKLRRAGM